MKNLSDRVSSSTTIAVIAGMIAFFLFLFVVPAKTVSVVVGESEILIFLTKVVISLILAALVGLGISLILNPKTAEQLAEEQNRLRIIGLLTEIERIGHLSMEAAKVATNSRSASNFEEVGTYLVAIVGRFKQNPNEYEITMTLELFKLYEEEIKEYLAIRQGDSLASAAKKAEEIEDTEQGVLLDALEVVRTKGASLDSGNITKKDVAHSTFRQMAKSLGLLDSMRK